MSGRPTSRRRSWTIRVFKLLLGLGIIGFVGSQLRIDDRVLLQGEAEARRGRGVLVEGHIRFTDREGRTLESPLRDGPIVEQRRDGSGWRVRLRQTTHECAEVTYEGTVRWIEQDTEHSVPLDRVALSDGAEDDGHVERFLEVHEGLATIFGRLSALDFGLAMALMGLMYVAGVLRWRILLAAQGLQVSLYYAVRLTFIGFFFNNVVPGLTGGDVVKAVMVARHNKGRGAEAVSTVIVDRVLGLLVLAAMSAVVLLATFPRYREIALGIFGFLGISSVVLVLFFSRRVRRALALDALLRRLPGAALLKRLDEAFLLYRNRRAAILWSVLLSALSHAANVLSVYLLGIDLGVDRSAGLTGNPLVTYFATVPVILIGSSVPLLPGGWGLGELMYAYFFRTVGVRNVSLTVGLSVLTRTAMLLWSLLGGMFLMVDRQSTKSALEAAERNELVDVA